MTKGKKPATGGGKARKLKIKKETVKDLDARPRGPDVKAGNVLSIIPTCLATCNCVSKSCFPCHL